MGGCEPHPLTRTSPSIANLLKRHPVQATFHSNGSSADSNSEQTVPNRRVVQNAARFTHGGAAEQTLEQPQRPLMRLCPPEPETSRTRQYTIRARSTALARIVFCHARLVTGSDLVGVTSLVVWRMAAIMVPHPPESALACDGPSLEFRPSLSLTV